MAEADQAKQAAQTLRTETAELITLAKQAEAQAAEYRQLAKNPPQTKETTVFVYNLSGQMLGEYSKTGKTIREYIWLDDMPVAMIQGNDTYYIHSDHINTPIAITGQNQNIVWKAEYKPFGEVNEVVADIEFNLRRPGQYFDSETGLHYNWFRDYDPETGRYIQSDPIGLQGGLNTYVYVSNRPIIRIDIKGLKCSCVASDDKAKGDTSIEKWWGQRRIVTCSYRCKKPDGTQVVVMGVHTEWYLHSPRNDSGLEGLCIGTTVRSVFNS